MKKPRKQMPPEMREEDEVLAIEAGFDAEEAGFEPDEQELPTEKQKPLGTSKAVETMFRNAVRAEMDLIALAATKANIMISLNGLIISALMISGAFIFANSAVFLLPAGVFMATAAVSIVFALMAASPERAQYARVLGEWARAVWRKEAGWRDLRSYMDRAGQTNPTDKLNLLIYEDRVRMTPG